jgi:hypothetical protein
VGFLDGVVTPNLTRAARAGLISKIGSGQRCSDLLRLIKNHQINGRKKAQSVSAPLYLQPVQQAFVGVGGNVPQRDFTSFVFSAERLASN